MLLGRGESDREILITSPTGRSTGTVLEWTEIDPNLGGYETSGIFQSLGNGRILIQTYNLESSTGESGLQFLTTKNGIDWSEVPLPTELWLPQLAFSSDRWLIVGYDFAGNPLSANPETAEDTSSVLKGYRAFYSDDEGANWSELEFDFSSSSIQVPPTYDTVPYYITAALTTNEQMVIVLQGDETQTSDGSSSNNEIPDTSQENTEDNPIARIFASDGGALEQVAEYSGFIYGNALFGTATANAGFSLQLYVPDDTAQASEQLITLHSSDGRTWHTSENLNSSLLQLSQTPGSNGSLWRTDWLDSGYGLRQVDRDGALITEVAFDNAIPSQISAGPSGLLVNVVAGTDRELFAIGDQQITKNGYTLRLNQPEGGFTFWDPSTNTAIYECGPEALWARRISAMADCQFTYPENDNAEPDAKVIVFEDRQTGAELASFTRGELAPAFPLWVITGLEIDSPKDEEQFLGWSADGTKWGWQTPTDAFGIDLSNAQDSIIWLAVGNGFALARVQQFSDDPLTQDRWFITQVQPQ